LHPITGGEKYFGREENEKKKKERGIKINRRGAVAMVTDQCLR